MQQQGEGKAVGGHSVSWVRRRACGGGRVALGVWRWACGAGRGRWKARGTCVVEGGWGGHNHLEQGDAVGGLRVQCAHEEAVAKLVDRRQQRGHLRAQGGRDSEAETDGKERGRDGWEGEVGE